MNKVLHIAPDEKFIDYVIALFDSIDWVTNDYVITKSSNLKLNYIKNKERVSVLSEKEILSPKFIRHVETYDVVLLHLFYGAKVELVNRCKSNVQFVCLPWGADIYHHHPTLRKKLYLTKTNILSWRTDFKYRFKNVFKPIFGIFKIRKEVYKIQEKAFSKIKYIAPVIFEDYQLIKTYYKNSSHCQYLPFAYGDITSFARESLEIKGNNILLGNSASATNNHMEAIDILSKMDLSKKRIIVPLSYGNQSYAKKIIKYGKKSMFNNFVGLTEFFPIKKYTNIIESCGFVIMNHKRQQGMGNIYAALYGGAKLFLRKDNPTYRFLKNKDITLFTINDLAKNGALTSLTEKQKKANKDIIHSFLSPSAVKGYAQNLIKQAVRVT